MPELIDIDSIEKPLGTPQTPSTSDRLWVQPADGSAAYAATVSAVSGASVVANLDGVADTATYVRMTPAERTKLSGIQANAQVNPASYTADQITETTNNKVMTATERTKLAGIEALAVAAGAAGDNFAATHPSGGHSADAITDGSTKVMMTPAERATIANIPATVADAVTAAGAVKSGASSDVVIGAVSVRDTKTKRADTTIPSVNTLDHEVDNYFQVQHFEVGLPAASADPVYYTLPQRVNTAKSIILYESPRARNAGPTGDYSYKSSKYAHVKIGWSDSGRTLRIDPVNRGEADAAPATAAFCVVTYIGPEGGAYEFQNLGTYDVTLTGTNTQKTQTFTTPLASDAVREKVWICCDHGDAGAVSREMGQIAWPHSNSAFTVVSPRPTTGFPSTFRCQVIHFVGSGWALYKAYGLIAPTSGTVGASSAAVVAGGTGYTNAATVTLSGSTGTACTFTTTVSGGVVTGLTIAAAGSMSARPSNPASFTGGGGTGLTAFIHYVGGADAGDLTIQDKYPTAFSDGTRTFTDAAGVASISVPSWTRAGLLPGGYLGIGGTAASALISTDGAVRVLPGTGADATQLGSINWKRNAAGTVSDVNLLQVILVDTIGGALGLRVTRATQATPADATTTDVSLTSAEVVSKRELLLVSRSETATAGAAPSGSSGSPPSGGTLGFQVGLCKVQYYESGGTKYARITAPPRAALTAVDIEAWCMPRGVLPS